MRLLQSPLLSPPPLLPLSPLLLLLVPAISCRHRTRYRSVRRRCVAAAAVELATPVVAALLLLLPWTPSPHLLWTPPMPLLEATDCCYCLPSHWLSLSTRLNLFARGAGVDGSAACAGNAFMRARAHASASTPACMRA